MNIRTAKFDDAISISKILEELAAAGKRTLPTDRDYVLKTYIANPEGIRCSVFYNSAGTILGFQSLVKATNGNKYGTPVGWGIIGTHVSPAAARLGVATKLFETTKAAALGIGLSDIEAFIDSSKLEALAYYEKLGFRTYREVGAAICKRWHAAAENN